MKCKICQEESEQFAEDLVMGRHRVAYFGCPNCDFIQTQPPTWLKEAYDSPINRTDVGYVSRNVVLSRITHSLIACCFSKDGPFIDYGGGYGLFVRMMRDRGFDFFRQDRFCPNLFAPDFEAIPGRRYELLTAFEVFEHLENPLGELEQMLAWSDSIFLSTNLTPEKRPLPGRWWYYGLDHGQHIAFYSLKSLQVMADRMNLHLYSNGPWLHLFSKRKISPFVFRMAVHPKAALLTQWIARRKSLLLQDHQKALQTRSSV